MRVRRQLSVDARGWLIYPLARWPNYRQAGTSGETVERLSPNKPIAGLPSEPASSHVRDMDGPPEIRDEVPVPQANSYPVSGAVRRRQTTFRRFLGIADALSITVALYLSAVVVGNDTLTAAALGVPLLFVFVAKLMGLYDRDAELLHKTTLDEVPKLLSLSTSAALALWLADGLLVNGVIGRDQVVVSLVALFVCRIVTRSSARAIAIRMTPAERCLFIGHSSAAEEFREKLAGSHAVRADVVGWLPIGRRGDEGDLGPLVLAERIRSLVTERDVHRIVLGPGASEDELLDAVRRVKANGVKVSVLPNVARLVNASVELDRLNGITLLGLRRFEITFSSRFIKRAFDLAGSAVSLVILSPVLLATAIAIRLYWSGPVLFRQVRAGRHGEPFEVVKFRSMIDGAEEQKEELRHLNESDGFFKIAQDPRITRVGRVIRRFHFDELPQLLNVMRGEMSLVGPRPLVL